MVRRHLTDFEEKMTAAFAKGFANASRALEQMTQNEVAFNHFHSGYFRMDSTDLSHDLYNGNNGDVRTLLTTEIFGDVTGKSYLFLSARDHEVITKSIPSVTSSVDLKEEFLKELDNILSAAVITKLSNELGKKMFGDIPVMVGQTRSRIENIISDDFSEEAEEVYISAVSLSIGSDVSVGPLFVWVLDCAKLEVELVKS